jgi:hypothetical protein
MKINRILITGGIICLLLLLYAGQNAPGITYDSQNFLYASQSFFRQGILLREENKPFLEYAPLYPVILAGLRIFPFTMLQTIVVFQAVLMAVTVGWLGKICYPFFSQKSVFTIFFIALVFGSPLLLCFHFVWAESIFIFLSVTLFYLLLLYQHNSNISNLTGLLAAGMLLCLTRFAGCLFLPAIFLILLRTESTKKTKYIFLKVGLYSLLMILPLLLFWLANLYFYGYSLAVGEKLTYVRLTDLITQLTDTLTSWILPDEIFLWLRLVVIISLAGFIVKVSVLLKPAVFTSFVVFITYCVLVIPAIWHVKSYVYAQEVIDDRMLAPVYIFGMLLFFLFVDDFCKKVPKNIKKVIILLLFCWLSYPVARGIKNVIFWQKVSKIKTTDLLKF